MALFVTTIKFTDQGMKAIGETTKRAAKKMGVKVKDIYWTLGDHDGLLVLDAPDDETVTALLLHLGSQGNVHTSTSRAYTAAEMEKVLAKMGGG
jgi:uncharacterized protein with GYD domain